MMLINAYTSLNTLGFAGERIKKPKKLNRAEKQKQALLQQWEAWEPLFTQRVQSLRGRGIYPEPGRIVYCSLIDAMEVCIAQVKKRQLMFEASGLDKFGNKKKRREKEKDKAFTPSTKPEVMTLPELCFGFDRQGRPIKELCLSPTEYCFVFKKIALLENPADPDQGWSLYSIFRDSTGLRTELGVLEKRFKKHFKPADPIRAQAERLLTLIRNIQTYNREEALFTIGPDKIARINKPCCEDGDEGFPEAILARIPPHVSSSLVRR